MILYYTSLLCYCFSVLTDCEFAKIPFLDAKTYIAKCQIKLRLLRERVLLLLQEIIVVADNRRIPHIILTDAVKLAATQRRSRGRTMRRWSHHEMQKCAMGNWRIVSVRCTQKNQITLQQFQNVIRLFLSAQRHVCTFLLLLLRRNFWCAFAV